MYKHSAAPYMQYGSQLASSAWEYTCDQVNSTFSQIAELRTSSGIPIQTWLQWHWTWFLENCESIRQHLHHYISINYLELYHLFNRTLHFLERKGTYSKCIFKTSTSNTKIHSGPDTHIFLLFWNCYWILDWYSV